MFRSSVIASCRRAGVLVICLALPPVQALAQRPEVVLAGEAKTGGDSRVVHFRLFCTPNSGPNVTGALSVALEVPQVDQLRTVFDFDPFEGPDASAGALTHVETSGVRTKAQGDFRVSGAYVPAPPGAFMLELSADRRAPGNARLKAIAALLRPLIDAPARLIWRQGNANPKGLPMVASLQVEQADAERLRTALSPCLAAK